MMYIQDYDETFPIEPWYGGNPGDGVPVMGSGDPGASPNNYKDELLPYIKTQEIWLCPNNIPNGSLDTRPPNIGYHMNGNVITRTGLTQATIAATSSLFIMRESGRGYVFNRAYLRPIFGYCDDVVAYEQSSPQDFMPHMKGYNLAFADGHGKWYLSTQAQKLAMFPQDADDSYDRNPGVPYCHT